LRDGRPLRQAPLNAGQPIRAGGLSVQQTALGSLVTAYCAGGRLEAYPPQGDAAETLSLAFGPQETERYFRSLASGASYRVTLSGAGLQVEAYRRGDAAPALRQTLRDGDSIELDGERVIFSLGRYVILNVRQDPAWGGLAGGVLLALAGVGLSLFCRPGRVVCRLRQEGEDVLLTCAGECPAGLAECPALACAGGDDGR